MRSMRTLLLVEDNAGDARLLREMLDDQGAHNITLAHVESMIDAETYLAKNAVDVILLDLGLPDAQGLEGVLRARKAAPRVPLVVLTGLDDESLASQALKSGAQAYLVKGEMQMRPLLRALRDAVERYSIEEALVRGSRARPRRAQQHHRWRPLHGFGGQRHLPQCGCRTIDGLVAAGSQGKSASEFLQILDTISRTPPNPMKWRGAKPAHPPSVKLHTRAP